MRELKTIQEEALQASILIQHLDRFAHGLEKPWSVFAVHEALEEIKDLLLKQARRRGVHLEIKPAGTSAIIETDPTCFQLAILYNVEQVMAGLESGRRIFLEFEIKDDHFQVCITGPEPEACRALPPEGSDDQGFYRDIVEDIGGKIRKRSAPGRHVIALAFPLADDKT